MHQEDSTHGGSDGESILFLVSPVQSLRQHQLAGEGSWPCWSLLSWGKAKRAGIVQGEGQYIVVGVVVIIWGEKSENDIESDKNNWWCQQMKWRVWL